MSGAAAAGAAGGAGGRRSANAGAAGSDGDTITVAPPTADRSQDDAPLTAEEMEAARSKRKRADVGQSTLAASGFMWTAAAPVGGRGSAGAGAKAPAVTVADDATMVFDVKRHYSQPDQKREVDRVQWLRRCIHEHTGNWAGVCSSEREEPLYSWSWVSRRQEERLQDQDRD